jgi:hypothetical protein
MRLASVACVAWIGAAAWAAAQEATHSGKGAVLRALDKYTGNVVDIDMAAGALARFGRLELILTECRYPAGNPSGDAFAGLQVREQGEDGVVFSGWMVASSPALNAMEHPRYDVWVLRCKS